MILPHRDKAKSKIGPERPLKSGSVSRNSLIGPNDQKVIYFYDNRCNHS